MVVIPTPHVTFRVPPPGLPMRLLLSVLATVSLLPAVELPFPGGRIAITHDGNLHDRDDHGALAMNLALITAAGQGDRLVHLDYNNHLGRSSATMAATMRKIAEDGRSRFALKAPFFDLTDAAQLERAILNFKTEAERSSATDPLWFICSGPMETAWRCIDAVDPAKRPFIRAVSHSDWNDRHVTTMDKGDADAGPNAPLRRTWEDVKALGVKAHRIAFQSKWQDGSDGKNTPDWYWLRDSANADLQWMWASASTLTFRDDKHPVPYYDVSDAGMTYWVLAGADNAKQKVYGVAEAKALLEGWAARP